MRILSAAGNIDIEMTQKMMAGFAGEYLTRTKWAGFDIAIMRDGK